MHADVLPRRHGDTEKNKIWGVLLSNARKPENSAITASNLAKIVWEQGIASTNHKWPQSQLSSAPRSEGSRAADPLRRFRAWQKHTSQSTGIHAHWNNIRFCQR